MQTHIGYFLQASICVAVELLVVCCLQVALNELKSASSIRQDSDAVSREERAKFESKISKLQDDIFSKEESINDLSKDRFLKCKLDYFGSAKRNQGRLWIIVAVVYAMDTVTVNCKIVLKH